MYLKLLVSSWKSWLSHNKAAQLSFLITEKVLNSLLVLIFLPFFQAIVLLAASKFLEIGIFGSFKIVITISAFFLINLMMVLLALFAAIKAAKSVTHSELGKVIVTGIKAVV